MPGIVAIISKESCEKNRIALESMVKCMHHEDFYMPGTYVDEERGVYLGWCIHKESFSDCMPVFNEKKDIILIFYGENHTDKDVLDELKGKNHKFDAWNASYLVHMYEEEGEVFLRKLNGWFTGILLDLRNGKTIVFNDRYGMQRLYYHEEKESVYFSSEAKCLLKINPRLREIPNRSLAEFLYCRCVLQNRTLFKEVYLLPGSSEWIFEDGRCIEKKAYFDPSEMENQPMLEKESFYIKLNGTLKRILPRYVRSRDPIALSLTGGLDSRLILACMEVPVNRIRSYTNCGFYRESYDVKIARKVAETCGLNHEVLSLDDGFFSNLANLAEKTIFLSDGYMDLSGAPSLYLHQKTRELGQIRLTGNYGGQVLKGIKDLKAAPQNTDALDKDFVKELNSAAVTLNEISAERGLSFFLFKQVPWYDYGRFVVEQSQLIQRSPYMDNDLIGVLYQAPPNALDSREITMRLIAEGNPALSRIPTDRGLSWSKNFLSSKALHLYRETLFKTEYYFSYGMPHWLAKMDSLLESLHIDKAFIERHKYYNVRKWFRDDLADYIRQILLDERTLNRPFINKEFLEKVVNRHVSGKWNYSALINLIMTIELTFRLLIEDMERPAIDL